MKSLQKFKQEPILEEEKTDYSKFDVLVRAGLANKAQMQRIHRILDKMQEERPNFNNADKAILQNMFNKMVDVITNNKQIFQQTRRAVHEGTEEQETVTVLPQKKIQDMLATADFKVGESGKKVRAHRFKIEEVEEEQLEQLTEQPINIKTDPPFVLVLKRKALRLYPNGIRIALYHNDKLDKYFSVPYSTEKNIEGPIQAEETQIPLEEEVMDHLHRIVKEKQAATVKFANGQTKKVDGYTASAITKVHSALNDENKKKFAAMVHKSPEHFAKAADFAFKKVK